VRERRRPFDEVKDEIRRTLVGQREQEVYQELLLSLSNKYEVIRNEELIQKLVRGL